MGRRQTPREGLKPMAEEIKGRGRRKGGGRDSRAAALGRKNSRTGDWHVKQAVQRTIRGIKRAK